MVQPSPESSQDRTDVKTVVYPPLNTSKLSINPPARGTSNQAYPSCQLACMHRLKSLGPCKEHKQSDDCDGEVANEELIEIRAFLLDNPPARLPSWYLAVLRVKIKRSMRRCTARPIVFWGIAPVGWCVPRRTWDAVHESTIAEWLTKWLVKLLNTHKTHLQSMDSVHSPRLPDMAHMCQRGGI